MSVTKRLSQITLEDSYSVSSVLDKLPVKAMLSIYAAEHATEDLEKVKKPKARQSIEESISKAGTKYFVENLNLAQLQATVAPLKIDHEKSGNNPNSKTVLAKRLSESITKEGGVAAFLNEYIDEVDVLKSFVETFEITTKSSTKDALIAAVSEAIEQEALFIFFSSFSEELLRDVAWEMKLEKDDESTASRKLLVECIIGNKEVPPKTSKPKIKVSKTKPDLKKGAKYQDVFQHYLLPELVEFAEKNNIKKTGTKKELIERILAWLDGDKENTVAGTKRVGRRKKAAPKKAAQPKKKVPTPKPVVEEKVVPVEEEVEEEADAEEEAEEEEDELDLDNLEQYPLSKLKEYCESETLKVKGTKKADYINAIEAYNNEQEE